MPLKYSERHSSEIYVLHYTIVNIMDEKEMQEHLVFYQLLQATFEQLEKQMAAVQKKLVELVATKMAIHEIEGVEKEKEILLPIGAGVYGHGKIAHSEKVLVNVGANILINKKPEDAAKFVEERKREIMLAAAKIETDMKQIVEKMNDIATVINEASSGRITEKNHIKVPKSE